VSISDHRQHFGNGLVLRSRRDEWIMALPGCFNVYRASTKRTKADDAALEMVDSVFRRNFDEVSHDVLMTGVGLAQHLEGEAKKRSAAWGAATASCQLHVTLAAPMALSLL
jgi:hypothetical protein